ncbi:MAG: sulfatase-like hydrolase/transferase [Planctomycetota bacterium]
MRALVFVLVLLLGCCLGDPFANAARPNVLIVTVDDMSADSLGAYGCKLPDTSPNIDRFASQSLRFRHGHVPVGNCMPGRNIMWSGLYSHINGVEGFRQNPNPDYPVLCDLAKAAGYFTAIRGKVSHSTPYHPYDWDAVLDTSIDGSKYHIKDAASYGESARAAFSMAKDSGKPFCLMVNISDPHKPFYAEGKGGVTVPDRHVPTRVFTPDEVPVPGFLPDDPVVRKELSHYYSSVRRADDCFGAVMAALKDSGKSRNTFVMFLSDHGMPLPFAKTQLYHHSTHTPLMLRWPGVITEDVIDDQHLVSSVDFIPTLLEVMQAKHPTPERLHGKSMVPLMKGQIDSDRSFAILQYNENSGRNRHPMRGITTRNRLYIYNPWSNGERNFATATDGTSTYKQMVRLAADDPAIAGRVQLIDHRVVEEFFDIESDPDCLHNLVDDPKYAQEIEGLRNQLAQSLEAMNDPVAPLVADIDDVGLRERFMKNEDAKTEQAKLARSKNKKSENTTSPKARRRHVKEFSISVPKSTGVGETIEVGVRYRLAKQVTKQKLHVTLKTAAPSKDGKRPSGGKRLHREVVTIENEGEAKLVFEVPADTNSDSIVFAAFIGEDFQSSLQHIYSDVIELEKKTQ